MTDPWAAPAAIPSNFPTVSSFRGRLVLIEPLSQKTVPNNLGAPGSTQEQVTANVTVVDGQGPVPQMKGNPPTPTGQFFDGPDFPGVWIQTEVIVKQLAEALRGRTKVLARIDTRAPGTNPGKGNPWGLIDATQNPADVQLARDFFAGRTVANAMPPAATPPPNQAYAAQAAAYAQPQNLTAPASNPFAQAAPPAAQTPGVNPFAPKA